MSFGQLFKYNKRNKYRDKYFLQYSRMKKEKEEEGEIRVIVTVTVI